MKSPLIAPLVFNQAAELGFAHADYVVSIRHVYDDWPREDWQRISQAQALYGDGLVEMCQGRTRTHFASSAWTASNRATAEAWVASSVR